MRGGIVLILVAGKRGGRERKRIDPALNATPIRQHIAVSIASAGIKKKKKSLADAVMDNINSSIDDSSESDSSESDDGDIRKSNVQPSSSLERMKAKAIKSAKRDFGIDESNFADDFLVDR
jgi:hypothetical protein